MIKLNLFSKKYRNHLAVDCLNMECADSQITGILGPNGAGKTTILKAITARHFATSGSVTVEEFNCEKDYIKVRNITGFVMENPDLPGEYKVWEYLASVAELHGLDCASTKINLEKVKEQCSLKDVWNHKISALSKGYKERVNFAQALVYDPKILVLDEPASGLDPSQILKMRELVKNLKQNHTIILSTHLMQEVDALCDKVYIINKGQCVASGTKESIPQECGCHSLEEAFFKLINDGEIAR